MKLNTFLAKVDCTLLDANTTSEEVENMMRDACELKCRAACAPDGYLGELVKAREEWESVQAMHPHRVKLCTVLDFPDGALRRRSRLALLKYLAEDSMWNEVDIVMPIGRFISGHYDLVEMDLGSIMNVARHTSRRKLNIKVIAETGYLNDEQIIKSAELVQESGAFCWKTSTGREPKVEIPEKARHVRMVREAFPDLTIKAAGGIRTQEDVMMLHEAGADIFGISWKALKEIVENWK